MRSETPRCSAHICYFGLAACGLDPSNCRYTVIESEWPIQFSVPAVSWWIQQEAQGLFISRQWKSYQYTVNSAPYRVSLAKPSGLHVHEYSRERRQREPARARQGAGLPREGGHGSVLKQIWASTTGLEKKRVPQMLPESQLRFTCAI